MCVNDNSVIRRVIVIVNALLVATGLEVSLSLTLHCVFNNETRRGLP